MLEQVLTSLGLTEKETLIYVCLLKLGAQPASTISKKTNINRTTCYNILEELSKKGLVFHFNKAKINYYEAAQPQAIKNYLDKEESSIKDKINIFKQNLDLLQNINMDTLVKPKIFFLEGLEGIKQTYQDTLTANETIFSIESIDNMSTEVKNYVFKDYTPIRVKKKIYAHSILSRTPENTDFNKQDKKQYRKTKIIKDPTFQFNFELNIYNDKASFIVFQENQYSSFIIQNKIIAEGLKSMHKSLWNNKTFFL